MKNMQTIKVKEIMNKNIIKININDTIVAAAKLMIEHNIGFLPVTDKGKIKGVLTDRDIINKIISKEKDIYASVSLAMTKEIISVNKNDDISIAISKMADNQIRRIVVLDNNEIKGIISISDIANHKKTDFYFSELMHEILMPDVCDLFARITTNDTLI